MKKTFTINISGIIFHIDDDAYEKLNRYLDTIKRHFRGTEGSEEIINDIETRVAEILQGKLSEKKQVINLVDIEEVISIMGEPSDFDEQEEGPSGQETGPGVAYTRRKRLYRDPDNKILGGVSSGLGAYFNIDPVWIRLLFVLLTIFSGVGILLYLILWIVVPAALTTTEKLEMRGEPVNISNIERSIKDEVGHIKDKLNDLTDEARQTFKKKSSQVRTGTDPVASFLREFGKIFLKILAVFFGLIILLIGIGLAIAFFAALFGISHGVFADESVNIFLMPDVLSMLIADPGNLPVVKTTLLLVLGIPIFMLLVTGVRMLFALPRQRTLGIIAFNVWLISFIVLVVFSIMIAGDFRKEEVFVKKNEIPVSTGSALYINLGDESVYQASSEYVFIDDLEIVISREGRIEYRHPELVIEKSNTDQMQLVMESRAKGKNSKLALERASSIEYEYQYSDSVITFDPYFSLGSNKLWRDQELKIILKVPEGTMVDIGSDMHEILGYHKNFYRYEMSGKRYIMGPDGLQDPDTLYEEDDTTALRGKIGMVGFILTGFTVI